MVAALRSARSYRRLQLRAFTRLALQQLMEPNRKIAFRLKFLITNKVPRYLGLLGISKIACYYAKSTVSASQIKAWQTAEDPVNSGSFNLLSSLVPAQLGYVYRSSRYISRLGAITMSLRARMLLFKGLLPLSQPTISNWSLPWVPPPLSCAYRAQAYAVKLRNEIA